MHLRKHVACKPGRKAAHSFTERQWIDEVGQSGEERIHARTERVSHIVLVTVLLLPTRDVSEIGTNATTPGYGCAHKAEISTDLELAIYTACQLQVLHATLCQETTMTVTTQIHRIVTPEKVRWSTRFREVCHIDKGTWRAPQGRQQALNK